VLSYSPLLAVGRLSAGAERSGAEQGRDPRHWPLWRAARPCPPCCRTRVPSSMAPCRGGGGQPTRITRSTKEIGKRLRCACCRQKKEKRSQCSTFASPSQEGWQEVRPWHVRLQGRVGIRGPGECRSVVVPQVGEESRLLTVPLIVGR
jgi:hypothetical protein